MVYYEGDRVRIELLVVDLEEIGSYGIYNYFDFFYVMLDWDDKYLELVSLVFEGRYWEECYWDGGDY